MYCLLPQTTNTCTKFGDPSLHSVLFAVPNNKHLKNLGTLPYIADTDIIHILQVIKNTRLQQRPDSEAVSLINSLGPIADLSTQLMNYCFVASHSAAMCYKYGRWSVPKCWTSLGKWICILLLIMGNNFYIQISNNIFGMWICISEWRNALGMTNSISKWRNALGMTNSISKWRNTLGMTNTKKWHYCKKFVSEFTLWNCCSKGRPIYWASEQEAVLTEISFQQEYRSNGTSRKAYFAFTLCFIYLPRVTLPM